MSEPIDLDDLQAVAELSWQSWEPHGEGEWFTRDGLLYGGYSFDVPDSDYIEAVPPAVVLKLIAELRETRGKLTRMTESNNAWATRAYRSHEEN